VEILVGDQHDPRIAVQELGFVVVADGMVIGPALVQPAIDHDRLAGIRDVDHEHAARVAGARVVAALGQQRDVARPQPVHGIVGVDRDVVRVRERRADWLVPAIRRSRPQLGRVAAEQVPRRGGPLAQQWLQVVDPQALRSDAA
jgi:hypothetical protein